jgi:hypothetical protein
MREDARQALAIDASSTIEDRTIDITTTGRRSGEPRRIEIASVPNVCRRRWLVTSSFRPTAEMDAGDNVSEGVGGHPGTAPGGEQGVRARAGAMTGSWLTAAPTRSPSSGLRRTTE